MIFLDQPLSDDPQARLLTQIQGAVAEYERIKIAERYRRGKLFRARQGEVCWWKVPYGYRRIPRRDGVPAHVEVSEPEAQVVRQIFRWHVDERLSVRQIALRLTESAHVTATGLPRWGISTVTRMLHNEAYIGTMYYNRHESVTCDPRSTSRRRPTRLQERPTAEWIPLPVPPIIDPDLFRRSQTIHHDNSRFSPRHLKSGHYLLRRVVRCRVCDLAMSCHRMRGRNGTFHHYYYCAGHDVLYARRAVGRCPQRNLRADELDELVWGEVRRHLEHPALLREGYARLQAQVASPQDDGLADDMRALHKQLTELDREEHRLLDAYQAGLVDLDQLRQRQERLRQRRAHVTGSIEVLQAERKTAQQQAQLQTDLETFVDTIRGPLATLDFDARQQLVRTVLERVMVEDGRVDIHFAIPLPEPPPDTTNPSVSTLFHLRSNGNVARRLMWCGCGPMYTSGPNDAAACARADFMPAGLVSEAATVGCYSTASAPSPALRASCAAIALRSVRRTTPSTLRSSSLANCFSCACISLSTRTVTCVPAPRFCRVRGVGAGALPLAAAVSPPGRGRPGWTGAALPASVAGRACLAVAAAAGSSSGRAGPSPAIWSILLFRSPVFARVLLGIRLRDPFLELVHLQHGFRCRPLFAGGSPAAVRGVRPLDCLSAARPGCGSLQLQHR